MIFPLGYGAMAEVPTIVSAVQNALQNDNSQQNLPSNIKQETDTRLDSNVTWQEFENVCRTK